MESDEEDLTVRLYVENKTHTQIETANYLIIDQNIWTKGEKNAFDSIAFNVTERRRLLFQFE